jgi:hypothetical protein
VKRFWLSGLALIFGMGLVLMSVFRTQPVLMVDQDELEEAISAEENLGEEEVNVEEAADVERENEDLVVVEESPDTAQKKGIDYYLPYPGLLPDHPLYWLKMVRDRVMLWLTQEPKARAQRLLLYADKRIHAALFLAEGNKPDLAVTTAMKAEQYLQQVYEQVEKLRQDGVDVSDLWLKLMTATAKHEEVLLGVLDQVPERIGAGLQSVLKSSEEQYQKAREMLDLLQAEVAETEEASPAAEIEEVEE